MKTSRLSNIKFLVKDLSSPTDLSINKWSIRYSEILTVNILSLDKSDCIFLTFDNVPLRFALLRPPS